MTRLCYHIVVVLAMLECAALAMASETLYSVAEGRASDIEIARALQNSPLKQSRSIDGLPDKLRQSVELEFAHDGGEGPGGKRHEFVVGGYSATAAILSFVVYGYIGENVAIVYIVKRGSWEKAGECRTGQVSTVDELIKAQCVAQWYQINGVRQIRQSG